MWKELIVYDIMPDRYMINDQGIIYDKINNTYPDCYVLGGYYHVNLQTIHGNTKSYTVHKLALASFSLCHKIDKNVINHKDTDKLNNNISNLEYCTPSENTRHAIQNVCRKLSDEEIIPNYNENSDRAGINNSNCKVFNEEQIRYICDRMQYNTPYPQILEELGLEVKKNYLDILTKIRAKKLWYCISKDYNIPNKEYRSKAIHYSEEEIRKICKLISEGYPCYKIAEIMNIKFTPQTEADKFRHFVNRIKNKKTFVNISDDYF